MMVDIRLLVDSKNHLGEGPLWDVEEQRLYWIDSSASEIWSAREDGSDVKLYYVPTHIGSMALRETGGAVLALANGFSLYDFRSQRLTHIGDPEADEPENRLNDGKVDRRGRFIAGYMSYDHDRLDAGRGQRPVRNSALYRLDPDLSITRLESGIKCSNGPCWSPDDRTFYFCDSYDDIMYAYDYDIETGSLSNRRDFASNRQYPGTFDGSTVDAEGYIWNAHVFGGRIIRYAPDGSIDREIEFPVRNLTSVMFGGKDLDILYVTSMGRPIKGVPQREAHAGGVFAVHGLGVKGLPEPRFGG
ncbi:SMP-30/gluconolactonase/LRE family protein [Ancylobacter amanitiformis]|uniref:Sugar lactone lactonase YvrE n=1 Tax=Ancylobacter amanitiformis TaxID=217069 RepID=A0ABU0LKW6_9HYPH|nr:SMP-30/gluconolactonase/LRE family protein [Ancylobacter amanitiformis]MDQ0509344.1 sugar lactone lactonase YvrE [Ancylobacter amanitiformis]